jgi:RNA-binding protein
MKLKSLAHHLKPILHVGKEGVSEATLSQIEAAFNTRELLKVKVQESAPDTADESGAMISGRVAGVHLVQVIGRTIVLYRRHPQKPEIELPQARTSSEET